MYTKEIFEMAMASCGYIVDKVIQMDEDKAVCKVEGRVKVPRKVTISGNRQMIVEEKKFRWDSIGRCFSLRSNIRQRRYDLPIPTILAFHKQQETEEKMH